MTISPLISERARVGEFRNGAETAESGSIRTFERRDIPRVCDLFFSTFRNGKKHFETELAASIEAIYLTSPAYSPEIGSIVHLDSRRQVDGFLGIINMNLRLGARSVRAGVMSAYMADRPGANPAIGVELARGLVSRPFDLLFSDTANRTSLDFSRAMRFTVLPLHSLEWMKVLRPFGTGAHILCRKYARLGWGAGVVAKAIDARMPRLAATDINPRTTEGTIDRPIQAAGFIVQAPRFLAAHGLRPSWDEHELSWLMRQASLRTRNGPLQIREVLDRSGRCIGLYLLYARPNGVAFALQILARPGREDMVIGNLVEQAKRLGAVAVRGTASPCVVEGLLRQQGVVYRNVMSAVARTTDPEIALALRSGDFSLGGLAGETWARIFADDFV